MSPSAPCVDPAPGSEQIVVRKDEKPYDVFVLRIGARRLVGIKTPARDTPDPDAPLRKGCLVEPSMVLGVLEGVEARRDDYVVRHRPIPRAQSEALLREADPSCDLAFPLRRLVHGRETAVPGSYWDARTGELEAFDAAEAVLREVVCDHLAPHLRAGSLVYDPACSSGAFLAHVKQRFPDVRTFGQDLSPAMIEIARGKVDRIAHGDSAHPACGRGVADVVVCRHLNLDVVVGARARALFRAAATALRPEGVMVVVGHTPVLLHAGWMEAQGFSMQMRSAPTREGHARMQLYLMRRPRAAPRGAGS